MCLKLTIDLATICKDYFTLKSLKAIKKIKEHGSATDQEPTPYDGKWRHCGIRRK